MVVRGDELVLLASSARASFGPRATARLEGPAVVALDGDPAIADLDGDGSFDLVHRVAPLDTERPVEESIARADQALLHAKATGRNRVCDWAPNLVSRPVPVRDLRPPVPEGILVGSRRDDFSARPASPDSAAR